MCLPWWLGNIGTEFQYIWKVPGWGRFHWNIWTRCWLRAPASSQFTYKLRGESQQWCPFGQSLRVHAGSSMLAKAKRESPLGLKSVTSNNTDIGCKSEKITCWGIFSLQCYKVLRECFIGRHWFAWRVLAQGPRWEHRSLSNWALG